MASSFACGGVVVALTAVSLLPPPLGPSPLPSPVDASSCSMAACSASSLACKRDVHGADNLNRARWRSEGIAIWLAVLRPCRCKSTIRPNGHTGLALGNLLDHVLAMLCSDGHR